MNDQEFREFERLRRLTVAQESKIRELEDAVAACNAAGLRLRDVLAKYRRGEEPSAQDLADLGQT